MQEQLKKVDGVTDVKVDFPTKTATVTLSKKVDNAALTGALAAPYSGKVVQ